jgi:hypothetical protein
MLFRGFRARVFTFFMSIIHYSPGKVIRHPEY